ncbi:MAG: sucrase ferredoxin, partial [Marinobacter sp.]
MTADAKRFCSVEHQRLKEPLVGKGGGLEPHLLLAWPRKKWVDHVFAAKDMPEAVFSRLEKLRDAGWRVQLIDRRSHDHSQRSVIAPMSGQAFRLTDEELPALLDAFLEGQAADQWCPGRSPERLILCCTHGKVDKCCAKFGNAAYQAVRGENERGDYGFDVWECTHVGCCRLAANLVTLPELRRYGWVEPELVPELLSSEARNRPYLPSYRGKAGLNALQQTVDLAARYWLEDHGIHAEPSVPTVAAPDVPTVMTVRVDWSDGHQAGALDIRCRSRE